MEKNNKNSQDDQRPCLTFDLTVGGLPEASLPVKQWLGITVLDNYLL